MAVILAIMLFHSVMHVMFLSDFKMPFDYLMNKIPYLFILNGKYSELYCMLCKTVGLYLTRHTHQQAYY